MKEFDLKSFRKKETKLTQEEFAKKIGVSAGTVGKIESGHQKISDNLLDKISVAFSIGVEEYKSYNQKKEQPSVAPDSVDWKGKYYELLEKYNQCLEQNQSKVSFSDKPIDTQKLKK